MKKVLVIDDNEMFRLIFAEWLKSEGFHPLMAVDGCEGKQLAHTYHPDIILCDVNMRGMDGIKVRELFHNDPEIAQIPFYFLSSELGIRSHLCRLPGVHGFISKQGEIEELRCLLVAIQGEEAKR